MIAHLWVSTATALAAVILVLLLRNVSARIRFAILLLATLRFAIPTPWLAAAGEALAACLPSRVIAAQVPSLEGLLHPGAFFGPNAPAPPAGFPFELVAQILWLFGALISLALWLRRNSTHVASVREASIEETAALDRAAVRMGMQLPQLKIAAAELTPGAVGIWRSEVVLSSGLAEELSADELESVCAHELAHIRRRDNLSAAISRAIAAVFWFHPLVWWMERRMRAERELACDEMVVASGPHEAYATALSKVCLASPGTPGSFAGMAGPNLTQRLERIMSKQFTPMGRGFRSIPATLALLALILPVGAGFLGAQGPTRPGDALFEQAFQCYKQKDYAQAEVLFLRMKTEFPADDRVATGLAEVYSAQNRTEEAVRTIRGLTEKNPTSFSHHVALGNMLVRTEQYKQALAEYEAALKLATTAEVGDVYFKMAETYRRMGRLYDALAGFRRAKDLGNPEAALQLALLLDGTGNADEAEREYRSILARDPNHAVALNNLAYRLAERGEKLDEALDYALRSQKAMPDSSDITDTVGWVYMKKRMPAQAESQFTSALLAAEKPDNALVRQHLAAAMDFKGDWTSARRELRTLLDTASTADQLRRLQELLVASQ